MRQFIRLMKALSDPSRVKILKMLSGRSLCVCQIQPTLGLAQPTVSSHLKVLEQAGLVRGFRSGQWMHYSLAQPDDPMSRAMLGHLAEWLDDDLDIREMLERLREIPRIGDQAGPCAPGSEGQAPVGAERTRKGGQS